MNDPNLNTALKWAIENSAASEGATEGPKTQITPEALAALMGYAQKSDADLMKESMAVIVTDQVDVDDRLQAFDNFEQLIENLDNANNMEPLKLWTPLVAQLENEHPHMRAKAASVCSVAVQNNIRTQERLLVVGALPVLVRMATTDTEPKARKKAVSALSSAVRNFQAGLDDVLSHMPAEYKPEGSLDANDMESVDVLINKLRESI